MEEVELLLSDEFVSFSSKIADIHTKKKVLQEEFKKTFDAFKLNVAELDKAAVDAQQEWAKWKTSQVEAKSKKK